MRRLGILLAALICFTASALAQLWTLTSADFQQRDDILDRIGPDGVALRSGGALKWDQVVALDQHAARPERSDAPFVLQTRDGQKLFGSPLRMDEESLTWSSGPLGELRLPLEAVRGWSRVGATLPEPSAQDDLVILQNNDAVRGIVEGSPDGISLVQGNAATPLKWDAIQAVALAKIGETPAAAGALQLEMTDGSVLLASGVALQGDQLQVSVGQQNLNVRAVQVRSIHNLGGRVRFWTSLEPAEVSYTPYSRFTDDAPASLTRMEQVTVNGRSYRDVVQLRPKAVLALQSPVDGKLHLQYAAGHAGRFTDMSLKVLVGSEVIHEAKGIRSAEVSAAVEAPVKKGDAVRLELDYGDHFDVQDFLWLLNAAFIGG